MAGYDKVALITGGTRGIGAAIARQLAGEGYGLALNGRSEDEETEIFLNELAGSTDCAFLRGDVSDPDACHALVTDTKARFGRLDTLVHCAGGGYMGTALDIDIETWQEAFDIHVYAVLHLFRAAHPHLKKRGGSVLLVSSAAGIRGCPGTIAYQTVKGALPQMARALARDHAVDDIRVNVIAQGIIETRFHANMTPERRQHSIEHRIPLRRFGTPEDVADASAALIRNRFITGETLVIDGGMTMRMV